MALLAPSAHATAGVVELRVTEPRTTRAVGLVWVADDSATPAVRVFRDFLLRFGPRLLAPRRQAG